MPMLSRLCALAAIGLAASAVHAESVVRHPVPDFPISEAVEVPSGYSTVYLSGMASRAVSGNDYGNTEVQTQSALETIQALLSKLGMSMGDVVKMQVFLAGDPAHGGKMDFSGFMKSYTKFFGTAEQPALPARSVMQVAALANPGWLVEIEVTAVRKK